ncbi:MAG: DUF6580 family putative transport protein [Candidatus Bathyarchaeia archaeon]
MQTIKISLISVLIALCLAIQLSPRPPNVEFTSLLTFTVGVIFGSFTGVLFGCSVMFVNGFLSPWGFAGLNMPFQMVGMGIAGLAGGIYGKFWDKKLGLKSLFEAAVVGASLTLIYDFVTNFGVAVISSLSGTPFHLALISTLISGVPFSLIHIFSNVFVFGLLFAPISCGILQFMEAENWLKKER